MITREFGNFSESLAFMYVDMFALILYYIKHVLNPLIIFTSSSDFKRRLACVASVSVRFSARSRHFSFFSRAKIGASAKKCVTHFFALAPIFARLRNEKCLERAENLTETLATQAKRRLKKLSVKKSVKSRQTSEL